MPRGDSGRIVIEVDTDLKRRLYSALAADSTTLKAWFINAASEYLDDLTQPKLPGVDSASKKAGTRS